MKILQAAVACSLLLFLAACTQNKRIAEPQFEPAASAMAGDVFQTGIASWYGGDFQGRVTAAGEIYDMHKLTAAHPDLPFHTLVEVENQENGKRVRVRVNDRGPFLKNRIIDLSLKAAQRLDMAEKGTAQVNLRILRPVGSGPRIAAGPGTSRGYWVQAGAFTLRENAEDLLLKLGEIFPGWAFRVAAEEGLFKVISPRLDSRAACSDVLQRLAHYRLQGFVRESGCVDEN